MFSSIALWTCSLWVSLGLGAPTEEEHGEPGLHRPQEVLREVRGRRSTRSFARIRLVSGAPPTVWSEVSALVSSTAVAVTVLAFVDDETLCKRFFTLMGRPSGPNAQKFMNKFNLHLLLWLLASAV